MTPRLGWAMGTTYVPAPYTRPSCSNPRSDWSTLIPWATSLLTIFRMVGTSCWLAGITYAATSPSRPRSICRDALLYAFLSTVARLRAAISKGENVATS